MFEEDKFNFISSLQPWAHAKLRRHKVKDLSSTIVVTTSLVDFKLVTRDESVIVPLKFKTTDEMYENRKKY